MSQVNNASDKKTTSKPTITIGQLRLDPPLIKSPLGPDHDIVMEMWGEKTTRKQYMFFQEWAAGLTQ